jgi:hypothetical protein
LLLLIDLLILLVLVTEHQRVERSWPEPTAVEA